LTARATMQRLPGSRLHPLPEQEAGGGGGVVALQGTPTPVQRLATSAMSATTHPGSRLTPLRPLPIGTARPAPPRMAGPRRPRAPTHRPCNDATTHQQPPPPLAPLGDMRGTPAAPAWGGGAAGVQPTGPALPAGAPAGRGARPQGGLLWRFPEKLAA